MKQNKLNFISFKHVNLIYLSIEFKPNIITEVENWFQTTCKFHNSKL